jgi:hypothetical protein
MDWLVVRCSTAMTTTSSFAAIGAFFKTALSLERT